MGPCGAGKSTQASIIASALRKKRIKVTKNVITSNHGLAQILWKLTKKLKHDYWILYYTRLKWLWWGLQIQGILLKMFVRIQLPLWLGYVVISDGYLMPQCAVILDERRHGLMRQKTAKRLLMFLLEFVPENMISIVLDAPTEILMTRYVARGSNSEPIRYITAQRDLCKLIKGRRSIQIDTASMSKEETFARIINYLSETATGQTPKKGWNYRYSIGLEGVSD
jgi:thymidylate kinase